MQNNLHPTTTVVFILTAPTGSAIATGQLLSGSLDPVFAIYLHALGVTREEVGIVTLYPTPTRHSYTYKGLTSTKALHPEAHFSTHITPEFRSRVAHTVALLVELPKLRLIIPLGAAPLLAFLGKTNIVAWNGSINPHPKFPHAHLLPTFDPMLVVKKWEWMKDVKRSMERGKQLLGGEIAPKAEGFLLQPSLAAIRAFFAPIPTAAHLSVDIETACSHILCIGVATSPTNAICIPFVNETSDVYSHEEELEIILLLRTYLLTRRVSGQSWAYDAQYIARWWGFLVVPWFDTMLAHHTLFPGTLKSLGYLSSLYLDWHTYWKDDHKDWRDRSEPEILWAYNCRDCVQTFEIADELSKALDSMHKRDLFTFQMSLWLPVMHIMLRGIRRNTKAVATLSAELLDEQSLLLAEVQNLVGYALNPRSPQQMCEYFYTTLGLPVVKAKATGRPTCGGSALTDLARKEPLILPLANAINRYREIGVLNSTFVVTEIDADHRIRTSLDIAGTETFRFASRSSVFHSGGNLQNVPKGVRHLFLPDQGMTIVDIDLAQADAQCVAWYADDSPLKNLFTTLGSDLHQSNADELGVTRSRAKMAVHAVNYGVGPNTLSKGLGISRRDAAAFRNAWFTLHPAVKAWHESVQRSLFVSGSVTNAFGYTRHYFERPDGLLPEALAWLGQSTVACLVNRVLVNMSTVPGIELLLQVHDSIVFQVPTHKAKPLIRKALQCFQVPVPFPDPRIIPADAQSSTKSWGDVERWVDG